MGKEEFARACEKVMGGERVTGGIGTLGEKTLHAVLKNYYEPYGGNQEIKVGSFVADIVGERGIIEIQTANFGKLIKKLDVFLEYCDVTVVYPMAAVKYLRWLDLETGELSDRRKSPQKLTMYDCARELYVIRYALDNPRFHLRLCLLELEEIRFLSGRRSRKNKKKGSTRCDRIPISLIDEIEFDSIDDYRQFIPKGLQDEFTNKDFAGLAHTDTGASRRIINMLVYLGIAENIGKKGNAFVYRINR